jgi:hypothetical protein
MRAPTCRCGGSAELRQREAFGRVRAVWQCIRPACGKVLSTAPVLGLDLDVLALPRFEHRRKPQPTARKRKFLAHYQTAEFREIRRVVLVRCLYRCELEGATCTGIATQLHEVTYGPDGGLPRLPDGRVDLRRCKGACRNCNLRERERRVAARVLGTTGSAGVAADGG